MWLSTRERGMRGHVQPRFGTRAGEWVAIIEPDDWIDPAMFEDTASFAGFFGERVEVVKTPWVEVLNRDNPDHERQAACRLQDKMSTSAKPFSLEERPLPIEIHLVIWSALDRRFFLRMRVFDLSRISLRVGRIIRSPLTHLCTHGRSCALTKPIAIIVASCLILCQCERVIC